MDDSDELTEARLRFATVAPRIGRDTIRAMDARRSRAWAELPRTARTALARAVADNGVHWVRWHSNGDIDLRGAFADDTRFVLTLGGFRASARGRMGPLVTWRRPA